VVAAAALYLADMPDPEHPVIKRVAARRGTGALLDPFCGSGTIPIEAASWAETEGSPIYASDLAPEAVAGTRANAACNGLDRRIIPRRADATELGRYYRDRGVTTIVCNPPFGVRLGKRINFDQFYRSLLDGAAEILPGDGRLVLLSSRRRGRLNAVIADSPMWTLKGVHLIETGGVFPGIFVLERRRSAALVD
jgi:putative N6-adenine-specific DNA methylase/tRNA (guanine6-N2)-methyltransferase